VIHQGSKSIDHALRVNAEFFLSNVNLDLGLPHTVRYSYFRLRAMRHAAQASCAERISRAGGASFGGASYELHVAVANKKTTPYDTTPLGVLRYNTTPSI
jgi:hypothetical protein